MRQLGGGEGDEAEGDGEEDDGRGHVEATGGGEEDLDAVALPSLEEVKAREKGGNARASGDVRKTG